VVFIVGLALVPAVFTVIQSFYRVDALDPPTRFTGFDNFVRLARQGRRQHRPPASTSSSARCSRPCWVSGCGRPAALPGSQPGHRRAHPAVVWGVVEGIL
jgi:ABC-type sugar transport system permease subunit